MKMIVVVSYIIVLNVVYIISFTQHYILDKYRIVHATMFITKQTDEPITIQVIKHKSNEIRVIVFLQRCALRSQGFAILIREYIGF